MFAAAVDLTDDALRRTTRLAAARLDMIEKQTKPVATVKVRLGGGEGGNGDARRAWIETLRAAREKETFVLDDVVHTFDLEVGEEENTNFDLGGGGAATMLSASEKYAAARLACFGDFDDLSAVERALERGPTTTRHAMQMTLDKGVPYASAAREVLRYV